MNAALPNPDPRADLQSLGVLPQRADELVTKFERGINCFLAWSVLIESTQLDPIACLRFLQRHGFYPRREL